LTMYTLWTLYPKVCQGFTYGTNTVCSQCAHFWVVHFVHTLSSLQQKVYSECAQGLSRYVVVDPFWPAMIQTHLKTQHLMQNQHSGNPGWHQEITPELVCNPPLKVCTRPEKCAQVCTVRAVCSAQPANASQALGGLRAALAPGHYWCDWGSGLV
jgi:hypothetical protein